MRNRTGSCKTDSVQPPKTKETWKMKNFWLPNREPRNGYQKRSRPRFLFNFLLVKNLTPTRKTTTKIGAARLPILFFLSGFERVFAQQRHIATHTTLVSSLPKLLHVCFKLAGTCACTVEAQWCGPETKDFLTTKTRVANHTLFPSTA